MQFIEILENNNSMKLLMNDPPQKQSFDYDKYLKNVKFFTPEQFNQYMLRAITPDERFFTPHQSKG